MSRRTIYRHLKALVKGGWFEQTDRPARPGPGETKGRRARYRVTFPRLDLSDVLGVTDLSVNLSHDGPALATASDTSGALECHGHTAMCHCSSSDGPSISGHPIGSTEHAREDSTAAMDDLVRVNTQNAPITQRAVGQ